MQVKNKVSKETAKQLSEGIEISASGGGRYRTSPCLVKIVDKPNYITEPEIPLHPNADYSWLEISLTEGKFHQVRKMVAAVHHKCIRLIRISIEEMDITSGNNFRKLLSYSSASMTATGLGSLQKLVW